MIFEKPIFTDVDQHLFSDIVKPTSANIGHSILESRLNVGQMSGFEY